MEGLPISLRSVFFLGCYRIPPGCAKKCQNTPRLSFGVNGIVGYNKGIQIPFCCGCECRKISLVFVLSAAVINTSAGAVCFGAFGQERRIPPARQIYAYVYPHNFPHTAFYYK